ncbi:DUF397 domain-containing protein [Streptomyces sp. Je 1-369]|uniref:DUF397 domain-containing protein n=1 Tax=Streptomyces sp. Je 1-369 TaxID=2966192 RepID=UPI0022855113|nr:DUF397 domain-containing protein [Streptomyces sp. Je 1-369]WAL95719.1 DUF397 domain-containing protein [Streptomyces sp. Je 1-369]
MPAVLPPFPPSALTWFKSSYSGGNTTECVETAFLPGAPGGVLIRDSKRADGPRLRVSSTAWARFVAATWR